MKKLLQKLLVASLLLVSAVAAVSAGVPNRQVYGYFLFYDKYSPYGWARFNMNDASNVEFIDEGDNVKGIFCGACAYGIVYYCEYEYSLTEGPIPSGFWSYNLSTGKKSFIGDYSDETSNPYQKFLDMTYDYSTETMYAVAFEMGTTSLYTFDLKTGRPEKVVELDSNIGTLACNLKGEIYGIDIQGVLYKVNKSDGRCEKVFDTGYSGMVRLQSMEFDRTTGELYWASNVITPSVRNGHTYLVKITIDGDNSKVEDIAELGGNAELLALHIPFVRLGETVPALPSDVKVEADAGGAPGATVSWTNPELTFGGKPLEGLKSVTIKRNGEVVATVNTSEPGKKLSARDENVPAGYHCYTLCATNETGDGAEAYAYAYVGKDAPVAPSDVKVTPADGCSGGVLTWTKPSEGSHGGFFTDEGLTYRIVRYPDKVEVGKDIVETTFTDRTMRRLGKYYYEVYACNAYGEQYAKTASVVLGKSIDVNKDAPFIEDFSNRDYFENRWTEVDANADSYTWTFNTQAPTYQFGSSAMGAEYFINPGLPNNGNDADEWLITPPLTFKAGAKYTVKISARTISAEDVTITIGSTNTVDNQTPVKSLTVLSETAQTPVPFTEYTVELPEFATDYTGCVGLHVTTPYPASTGFSFFHMTSFTVMESAATGIDAVSNGRDTMSHRIYNLNGQYMGMSLDGLAKGVYVRDGKKVLVK